MSRYFKGENYMNINISVPHMETIETTARLFGLPKHFVRQKVLTGEVVAVCSGRRYLVNVDKFSEYLNSNTLKQPVEQDNCMIKPIPAKL
jgi:excisionase family DNA binding protein